MHFCVFILLKISIFFVLAYVISLLSKSPWLDSNMFTQQYIEQCHDVVQWRTSLDMMLELSTLFITGVSARLISKAITSRDDTTIL